MPRGHKAAPGIVTAAGSVITAGALDAPWWVVVPSCLLATALAALHMLIPQNSADRLAWWKALWSRRRS